MLRTVMSLYLLLLPRDEGALPTAEPVLPWPSELGDGWRYAWREPEGLKVGLVPYGAGEVFERPYDPSPLVWPYRGVLVT